MKRIHRLTALALLLVMALGFAGCGSSKSASSAPEAARADAKGVYYTSNAFPTEAAEEYDYAPEPEEPAAGLPGQSGAVPDGEAMSEKIIYNADATLETTEFDETMEKIRALVKELGGYMESTSVSGSDYASISRGGAGIRNASFVIRIPSASFTAFTGSLSELGNVPYCRTYTRNITQEYYDTQSRLEAYRTQEKRLLEMLSIAETVEDMLSIQRELTEVQYELDSLTGTLRYYDNKVGYSTVNLSVEEVREYTPEPTVTLTYWQRMQKEFKQSLQRTGHFFTEFFLWLVTSLPWLVPLAAVIAVLIALLRKRIHRDPARIQARRERREEKRRLRREKRARKKGIAPQDTNKE